MIVAMVNIRIMRMTVRNPLVHVEMRVRPSVVPGNRMLVPVMLVMHMPVRVSERPMFMEMFVALSEMKPYARSHEKSGNPEQRRRGFMQQPQREHDTDERCDRKVCPRPRRTEAA